MLPIVWVVGAAAVLLACRPAAAWCEGNGTPGECRCRERAEGAAAFSGVHAAAAQPAVHAPGFRLITAGVMPAAPVARNVEAAAGAVVIVHVYDTDFSTNPAGQPVADPVIQAGDTIRWEFDSGFHTATSTAGSAERFNSDLKFPGDAFEYTFTTPGTFDYYCTVHGVDLGAGGVIGMAGTVTVVVPEPRTVMIPLLAVAVVLATRPRTGAPLPLPVRRERAARGSVSTRR